MITCLVTVKKGNKMIVAYSNGSELFVCEKSQEKKILKHWFAKETGRDVLDYDRVETKGVLEIDTGVINISEETRY
jgi:hypothetical protein